MSKPDIYIETSIAGYLAGRKSRDVIILAHQEITLMWWENYRELYSMYTSEIVLQEAKRGDHTAAEKRMLFLKEMPVLEYTKEIERLAIKYMSVLNLPEKAVLDAYHIAYAVYYKMDYLLTWNCTHLANEFFQRRLVRSNQEISLKTPFIVTPEELLAIEQEEI